VRRLAALALIGLGGLGDLGCHSYSGGARAVDPARVTVGEGWIVAGPPPALRQRGPIDCGPTALAMVAQRWDVPLSRDAAIAALPEPPPEGASLGDLRDLARRRGLSAFAIAADRATLERELRAGRPVLLGLHAPYGDRYVQSHYEVLVATRSDEAGGGASFVTIDPARGWRRRSWEDLDAEWRPAGRPALVVLGRAAAPLSVPRPQTATR
jgi:ABC-type bacteriocin/lantibiotic exporter with double-glycine peptidase domain